MTILTRAIAVFMAGFVMLHASAASATLMLTITTSGGTNVTITDGLGLLGDGVLDGRIQFSASDDHFSNIFIQVESNAIFGPFDPNTPGPNSGISQLYSVNTNSISLVNGASVTVSVTDTGFSNLSSSTPFVSSGAVVKLAGNGMVTASGLSSVFNDVNAGMVIVSHDNQTSTANSTMFSKQQLLTDGPFTDFSLTSNFTVTHSNVGSLSSFSMTTAVGTPEPGSMLVWGGITLAGVFVARRRREKATA